MTAKWEKYTWRFSLLADDGFLDQRQFLVDLFPYMIDGTVHRDRSDPTRIPIIILKNRLSLSHALAKPVLLCFRKALEVTHEPLRLQRIADGHENRELRVIQHAFEWELDVVADNDRYAQTLNGVEKPTRRGSVSGGMQAELRRPHPFD